MLTAEHINAATAPRKVHHLLPRNFTGRYTHTLAFNAMIATQKQMTRMSQ